jgi:hypothetical protein
MRRDPGQSLRFVRTLALLSALPGCAVHDGEVVQPPPPNGGSSGGGTIVQGDGVAQNNTVVVQSNNGGEDNVEMRTVVVGNQQQVVQPECAVGQVVQRAPNTQCTCVATSAGVRWQCAEVVAERCVVGQARSDRSLSCTCVNTARGPDWRCLTNDRDLLGPLPPPELEVLA